MESSDSEIERRKSHSERITVKIIDIDSSKETMVLKAPGKHPIVPKMALSSPIQSPKKLPILGIFVSISLYFVFGLLIVAASDIDAVVIGGFFYLLMLLATLAITFLALRKSTQLGACMFFTFSVLFLIQSALLFINIILFLANINSQILALLIYNTSGFVIFTIGTNFANYHYRETKAVSHKYAIVPPISI